MKIKTNIKAKTLEQRLSEWAFHPDRIDTFITPNEKWFIAQMRAAASNGVGYGWMQQIIEWEWLSTGIGAWGPEYFQRKINILDHDRLIDKQEIADLEHDINLRNTQLGELQTKLYQALDQVKIRQRYLYTAEDKLAKYELAVKFFDANCRYSGKQILAVFNQKLND